MNRLLPLLLAVSATPAAAQLEYSDNWNYLRSGRASLILGPAFFDTSGDGSSLGIGDSIRYCYSIDITQGGRNERGFYELAWTQYAQGFGAANAIPGVDLGPQIFHAQVSNALADDSCFSAFFPQSGKLRQETAGFILPGLIAGTGSFPINSGFFWQIAFQLLSPLPSGPTTLGIDPSAPFAGTPLLPHFMFEVQGPVNAGPFNRQYFVASTSEVPGLDSRGSGGVTNGNNRFGASLYGAPAEVSGAVSGARWTASDTSQTLRGGPLFVNTPGDTEFFGGVAFTTPNFSGAKDGSTGNGNADWVVSSLDVSEIHLRLLDRFSGAQDPLSGSPISNPLLTLNTAIVFASCKSASTMQQSPLSWDDINGTVPPQAGTVLTSPIRVTRFSDNGLAGAGGGQPLGSQSIHVAFDPCTAAFLGSGITLLDPFSPYSSLTGPFANTVGLNVPGSAQLGPLPVSIPSPKAAGLRLGLHTLILQAEVGGTLTVAEMSNAKTAVLQ